MEGASSKVSPRQTIDGLRTIVRGTRVKRRTSKSEVHTSELLLNEVRELLKGRSHRKCSATLNEPLNVATSQKGHRSVSKQNLHS
jgi:hypothetical protein